MAFIQDPRLRQTWNQLSHTTEAVTSDAAAGIWAFGHSYITPCLSGVSSAVDSCTAVCLGNRDERARRARERERGARGRRVRASRVEYNFDFYDDWEDDFAAEEFGAAGNGDDEADGEGLGGSGSGRRGLLGGWGARAEDWDRLLAGTGPGGRRYGGVGASGTGDVLVDQPRRKRGMSYGTRGVGGRRKVSGEEDPNVIPRTAPLGFLGRLPFKIVGSLRYKPSAANLKEHPGAGGGVGMGHHGEGGTGEEHENEPLLGINGEGDRRRQGQRPRSDTTHSGHSGDTSSSYRSRGDLFPSDEEGDEDAVPLGDEFAVALERVDDRGSTRTRSSKGKRPADSGKGLSRTVSQTTISSTDTPDEYNSGSYPVSFREEGDLVPVPSLDDLRREEEQAEKEEREEIERRRKAASQLAMERGLSKNEPPASGTRDEANDGYGEGIPEDISTERPIPRAPSDGELEDVEEPKPPPATTPKPTPSPPIKPDAAPRESTFVPARLPHFS
ncbi:hypothetical protein N657DRAFT_653990 [Parathielavia appendiculata]|uniref:Uncharacterized protein n=1 Tax=Parathielavia appendiculata TaxID=2587402 RepID=A0AAN6U7M4_9PEZI|nr:hypothetical protein N657DRAFT_653990 [Parathielavia appendiculata]